MSLDDPSGVVLPQQFGHYNILKPLGAGGMGAVFLARDNILERQVALKVCRIAEEPQALERFRREARAAAVLRHPNLCPVHEYGERDGIAYLTMAYIQGPSLKKWLQEHRLDQWQAALLISKLALAMQVAHDAGIIHRDLKPANIIMEKNEPVVVDFGLARLQDGPTDLTQDGAVYGTPAYTAPEQAGGDPATIGPGADVYALGVVFYELLTGRVPFVGTALSVATQAVTQPPPPPRLFNPTIDSTLVAICLQALAKRPAERFLSMNDFAAALETAAQRLHEAPAGPATQPPAEWTSDATLPAGSSEFSAPVPVIPERMVEPPRSPQPAPLAPRRPPSERRLNPVMALLLVVLLLAGAGAALWYIMRPEVKAGTEIENSIGMRLRTVPPGTFWMGRTEKEPRPRTAETEIRHRVTLTRGLYLSATLVTQKQWTAVMGADKNPSHFKGDERPVEQVTWFDAVEFCLKLSEKEGKSPCYRLTNIQRDASGIQSADVEIVADGKGYRLPTEAEWEYAARAGTTTPFWQGETLTTEQANFDGNFPYKSSEPTGLNREQTTPVRQFPPNAWGFHDMGGNLFQWCNDWQSEYAKEDVKDPQGSSDGVTRVIRGGSWGTSADYCRPAFRSGNPPGKRDHNVGFRVVLSLE